jgi:N6-adenosine-specific RNA methylase IME4
VTVPALSLVDATAESWAMRIAACWRASVEAILEVGRLLAAAKEALPHGEFGAMCQELLPFSASTAQRLMAIAADPKLSNPAHVQHLPPAWGTLYELTKLDPNKFQDAIERKIIRPDMERREITQAIKLERRETRERELGARQAALPAQRFGIIVADPEWEFEPWSRETGMDRAAGNHYPTSCTKVIADRDVPSIAAADCILWLWATVPMLPHALLVLGAWGFDYRSHYAWVKTNTAEEGDLALGTGYWNRGAHELLLIGVRGHPPAPAPGTQYPSVIHAMVTEHSSKPEIFLRMIEEYYPSLPKIELNRRGPARAGWTPWGNEADAAAA